METQKTYKLIKFNQETFITIPHDPGLDHHGNFTVEAWIKMEIPESMPFYISRKSDGTGSGYDLKIHKQQEKFMLCNYFGQDLSVISQDVSGLMDSWHHIAVSVSFSETLNSSRSTIYIDGKFEETATALGKTPDTAFDLFFGIDFKGIITEMRFWNISLSKEEIISNMDNSLTGRERGLAAYFPLNEDMDNEIMDVVSGTVYPHSITEKTEEDFPFPPVKENSLNIFWQGEHAYHESFNGFPSHRITTEFWTRTYNTSPDATFVSYKTPGMNDAFRVNNAQNITLNICNEEIETYISVADGMWHHIALTWHSLSGKLVLYKDGHKEKFETTLAKGLINEEQGRIALGKRIDSPDDILPFRGDITDFRIWNTVKSQFEIEKDMFFRLHGNEPGLSAYYPLNHDSGNIAKDITENQIHLDLLGCMWNTSGLFIRKAPVNQLKLLREERDQLKDKVEELKDKLEELVPGSGNGNGNEPGTPVSIPIEELIENTNKQISDAWKDIQTDENSLFNLKDVQMDIKMIPIADGQTVFFPTYSQLKTLESEELSSISLNFSPGNTTVQEPEFVEVPDLSNYTENMAIRKLTEINLTGDVSFQAVTEVPNEPEKKDRVVNQYPEPDTMVPILSKVTIFIGKES